jgi:hypothetical protein
LLPAGSRVEQRFRAREHRQQVNDVVLGVIVDRDPLPLERGVDRITKELAQVAHIDRQVVRHAAYLCVATGSSDHDC